LQRGKNEGLYREELDEDILAKYRVVSIFLIFNTEIFPDGKYSLWHIMEEITDNFLYGIATPKGIKYILKYKSKMTKK
jgi:hypothetical protein